MYVICSLTCPSDKKWLVQMTIPFLQCSRKSWKGPSRLSMINLLTHQSICSTSALPCSQSVETRSGPSYASLVLNYNSCGTTQPTNSPTTFSLTIRCPYENFDQPSNHAWLWYSSFFHQGNEEFKDMAFQSKEQPDTILTVQHLRDYKMKRQSWTRANINNKMCKKKA